MTVLEDSSYLACGVFSHNSSEPNLQNIPKLENDKWHLREAFITTPDRIIIAVDYKQLEMRLLAAAAMDAKMIGVFERGWDIHMGNASMMYGVPYDDVELAKKIDKKVKQEELGPEALTDYVLKCLGYRSDAKAIGFGLNYGMGANKLARTLGIERGEAQGKIDLYKETYPAVSAFYEEAIAETARTGYAFTVMGRRRNIPEIASHNKAERSEGERKAGNTQIQGSAADVVRCAQINLRRVGLVRRYDCRQLLNVHDEIVFDCPRETADEALEEIIDVMEHPFSMDLAVHLGVDASKGPSWGAAK